VSLVTHTHDTKCDTNKKHSDKATTILRPEYVPTHDDLLRVRARTTGICMYYIAWHGEV